MLEQQQKVFVQLAKAILKDVSVYLVYEERMEEVSNAIALYLTGGLNKFSLVKFIQTREYFGNYDFQQSHLDSILYEAKRYMERS